MHAGRSQDDRLVERLTARADAAERADLVAGFQDHADVLLLASVLAALTGLVGRMLRVWRRRRARQ